MTWQSDAGLPEGFQLPGYQDTPADPSKGTDVKMPDGTMRHFDQGQQPAIFIGDEYEGGYAAAVPGTEEYQHYQNMQNRSNVVGALQVATLVGGAALAGALLPAAGAGAPVAEAAQTFPYTAPGGSIVGSSLGAAAPVAASTAAAGAASSAASGFDATEAAGVSLATDPAYAGSALRTTFDSVTHFLTDNKDIVGAVLAGLGKGIVAGNEANAQADLLKTRSDLIAQNYRGANPNNTYRGLVQPTANPTPQQKFDVKPLDVNQFGGFEWQYDRAQGRVVRVPITPPRAQSA